MKHIFDVSIAKEYGIEEAILLENIYFWVEKNRANEQNFHDGYYWTYNSMKAFAELFPYLNKRKIEYALNKLKQHDLIKLGEYNKLPFDRTKWYTLTPKALLLLNHNFSSADQSKNKTKNTSKPSLQETSQNCDMDISILGNGHDDIVTPIPDVNAPYINSNINIISTQKKSKEKTEQQKHEHKVRDRELKEYFMENIWNRYPIQHRVGEKLCFSKFKSAIKNGVSKEEVVDGFNTYLKVIEINKYKGVEQYIKRLDNWFASEAWNNPNKYFKSQMDSSIEKQTNTKIQNQRSQEEKRLDMWI